MQFAIHSVNNFCTSQSRVTKDIKDGLLMFLNYQAPKMGTAPQSMPRI